LRFCLCAGQESSGAELYVRYDYVGKKRSVLTVEWVS